MNKVTPLIVSINDIACDNVPRSTFEEAQLTQAAQSILNGGGIITPLVLRRHGLEKYTVESGYFEYYAALRAYELDAIAGANIDAYIIDKTNEAVITEQMGMFRKRGEVIGMPPPPPTTSVDKQLNNILAKLTLLDRIEASLQPLGGLKGLDKVLGRLERVDHIQPILQRLEAIEGTLQEIKDGKKINSSSRSPKWDREIPDVDSLTLQKLNEISEAELRGLKTGIPKDTKLKNLVEARANQPFDSSQDLVNRANLTEKQFDSLINKLKGYSLKCAVPKTESMSLQTAPATPSTPAATEPKAPEVLPSAPAPMLTEEPAVSAVETQTPQPAESVQAEAALVPAKASTISPANAQPSQPTAPVQDEAAVALSVINTMPERELFFRLKRANLKDNVINELLKGRPYASFSDINISGLGKAGLEKLQKSLAG